MSAYAAGLICQRNSVEMHFHSRVTQNWLRTFHVCLKIIAFPFLLSVVLFIV